MNLIDKLNAATTEAELTAVLYAVNVDPHRLRDAALMLQRAEDMSSPAFLSAVTAAGVPAFAVEAYFDALVRLHMLVQERIVREAFAHAQHLMSTLGEEHPETMRAVIKALELQDPGVCGRMLHECGIDPPTASHVNADGVPMFALHDVAASLGVPESVLLDRAAELGVEVEKAPKVHRLQ